MIVLRTLLCHFETSPKRILGHLLKIHIDCGANAKAFVLRPIPADGSNHLLPDVIDGVALALRILPAADNDLLRPRSGALFVADKAQIAHTIERVIACLARIVAVRPWRQSIWALDQASKRRALRQRHFTRGFAKVSPRCRFRTVQSAAEINPVQVPLHYLLFAELFFDSL